MAEEVINPDEMIAKKDLIHIRPGSLEDFNFIKATWLNGLRYGNSWFTFIPKEIYYEAYSKVVDYLLYNPKTSIMIACLKNDPQVILGYSIVETDNGVLHWIYVRSRWRSIKLSKDLVPVNVKTVTHLTNVGKDICKAKGLTFNPFLIK